MKATVAIVSETGDRSQPQPMDLVKTVEVWHCTHTRKCGWQGSESQLRQVHDTRFKGVHSTVGQCPRCGNKTFYVRPEAK
jgi:hypothetical protein